MIAEFRRVEPYLLGDFWPLTAWSLDRTTWIAWQFDRPEIGEGFVQAFRRPESPFESARLHLRGLDPDAKYAVTDLDSNQPREMTGRELMDTGLLVTLPNKPAASVIIYHKAP
jgi:alpha-galactosidase